MPTLRRGAAAAGIEAACRDAVRERGLAIIACSGGETPWLMLGASARARRCRGSAIYVAQVDERIVPPGTRAAT